MTRDWEEMGKVEVSEMITELRQSQQAPERGSDDIKTSNQKYSKLVEV